MEILKQLNEAIVMADLDGIIVGVTPLLERMFNYDQGELLGQNVDVMIPHPYVDKHHTHFANYKKSGKKELNKMHRILIALRKGGSLFPVQLTLSRVDDTLIGIFRYQDITDYIVDTVIMIDEHNDIIMVNKQTEKTFGYRRCKLINKPVSYLFPDLELSPHKKTYECEAITKNNKKISVQISLSSIGFNVYILIVKDLSEINSYIKSQKELEEIYERLQNAVNNTAAASEAKTVFLANISHEIRTPMNGIYGMLSLLKETELTDIQIDYVLTCMKSAESLMNILDDILLFSKADANHLVLEKIPFNINDVVEDVVCIMNSNIAAEKNLDLVYYIDPDVPTNLIGDSSRLRQILFNLLSNGIKFTKKGEVALEIFVEKEDPLVLKFDVSDTGIGISKEQLKRLFKPFTQGDISTTRKYGGTGLGLIICKKLVELFKGDIHVVSRPGRGSTFTFTAEFKIDEKVERLDAEKLEAIKERRILVIDDNNVNCLFIESILQQLGCESKSVSNGLDGIEELKLGIIKNCPYDLLILDYHMPGLTGVDIARILNKDQIMIKILMISSSADYDDVIVEPNINGFLSKPIKKKKMIDALHNIVTNKSINYVYSSSDEKIINTNKKVLIVEDNFINRKVINDILHQMALKTVEVNNGLKALEELDKYPDSYALVLMDIHMPVMDGIETTKIIRSRGYTLPIIALTADISLEWEELCGFGFNKYITKPVNLDTLYENLREFIDDPPSDNPHLNGEPATILVADDVDINHKVFRSQLNKINYLQANNGQEAIERLLTNKIDIIFMDLHMPVKSGVEAAEEIRVLGIKTPIIGVTADNDCTSLDNFNEILIRPIEKDKMLATIKEYSGSGENLVLLNEGTFRKIIQDEETLKLLHDEYINQIEEYILQMEKLLANENHDQISKESHALKGASLQIGFEIFGTLAAKIEAAAKSAQPCEEQELFDLLAKYYNFYKDKYIDG